LQIANEDFEHLETLVTYINLKIKRMKKIFSLFTLLVITFAFSVNAANVIGDTINLHGKKYIVTGNNLITNPSFNDGVASGWLSGTGVTPTNFTTYSTGGVDNGYYVVGTANTGNAGASSIATKWAIATGKTYYFSHYVKYISTTEKGGVESYLVTSLTDGTAETKVLANDTLPAAAAGAVWTKQQVVFTNTVPYAYLQFRARWLTGRFGFDDFQLVEVQEVADNSFLQTLITYCEAMVGGKETEAFEAAITAAKAVLSCNDATQLNAAYSELNERLLDYKIANASTDYIVDVTDRYVKNAKFLNLLTDWTCGTIAVTDGINPIAYSHFETNSNREMELQNGTTAVSDNYCQQTITNLKKGYYRFSADMLAYNSGSTTDVITGTYLMCNNALTSVSTPGIVANKFYVEGVVTDNSIVIGMKTVSTNATTIYMDNVTLEYMGFDAGMYINSLRDEVNNYLVENPNALLPGVKDELEKAVLATDNITTENTDTLAMIYEGLNTTYKNALKSILLVDSIYAKILDVNNLLVTYPGYPGESACMVVLASANGLLSSGPSDIETSQYQDVVDMMAALKQAVKDYILSQAATATTPADFTLLIQNPSFRVEGAENTSTATLTSVGWTAANVQNSGDVKTSFNQNNTCWNSWSSDFTSMDVYQDITGLPAGIYTVSCNAITQAGDLNDQHAYIKSSLTTTDSPIMTTESWYDATSYPSGSGLWEKLETGKVVLLAGDTLRIGFASTHNSASTRGTNGWFSVTDFAVKHYGSEGTDAVVQGDLTTAINLNGNVMLQGDKTQITAYLDAANASMTASEGYAKVYGSLNQAKTLATASVLGYNNFINGTYGTLTGMVAMDTLSTDLDAIYTAALGIANDSLMLATASYTNLTSLEAKLAGYLPYEATYNEIATFLDGVTTPNVYTTLLQTTLNNQKAAMSTNLLVDTVITAYQTQLENLLVNAKLSLSLTTAGEQDLTYAIKNQELATTGAGVVPEGWTVSGNVTSYTSAGQYQTGNTTKRYFDTYLSAGGILFSGYQTVKVPNGTYQMNAIARTTKPGVYLYAVVGTDTVKTEVPLAYHVFTGTNVLGEDSLYTAQVSDTYGPLWEAAEAGSAIKTANSGTGRGWGQYSINDIVVTNNELTIGFSSDSTITGHPFTGTWFSVVDFTLTLKTLGDNTNWVISALKPVSETNADLIREEFFLINGARMSRLVKGFNIVRRTYSDGTIRVEKIFQQ
jgi:hypothetical protein